MSDGGLTPEQTERVVAIAMDLAREGTCATRAITGALFKGAKDVVAVLREAGADLDAGTPTARAARHHVRPGTPAGRLKPPGSGGVHVEDQAVAHLVAGR
ncbi:hypothetical protein [Saccharopolyspora sp. CA-218241]|uniref:hypothetical protein n=1 Tax=Saccharopolyspora sp. CA-218241 TaxID=3240027 RepID=UPI003D96DA7C